MMFKVILWNYHYAKSDLSNADVAAWLDYVVQISKS